MRLSKKLKPFGFDFNSMQLKDLMEAPFVIGSYNKYSMGLKKASVREEYYKHLLSQKNYSILTSIKSNKLLKYKDTYLLVNKNDELMFGMDTVPFADGLNIVWMQNFSNIKKLMVFVITELLRVKESDIVYSDNTHTEESMKTHINLLRELPKQLSVQLFNRKTNTYEAIENPYDFVSGSDKYFAFALKNKIAVSEIVENSQLLKSFEEFSNEQEFFEFIVDNFY